GVWVFGAEVHELVAPQEIGASWRKQAQLALDSIVPTGDLSDINAAIDAATDGVEADNGPGPVSVLLFSDGKLAVSSSPMTNANASRKLLTERTSSLAEMSVRVHTVALSDDADRNFLHTLARTTDGLSLRARTDRELHESLFQLLQTVVPGSRAPLVGGEFLIDAGVSAFTSVLYHRGKVGRIGLQAPGGDTLRPTGETKGAVWFVNDTVALATVKSPEPGRWSLRAPNLEDAQVRLDTRLGIDLLGPEREVGTGEPFAVHLVLKSPDGVALVGDAVSQLAVSVRVLTPAGEEQMIDVVSGDRDADGRYEVNIPALAMAGRYELTAIVGSPEPSYEFPIFIDVVATQSKETISTRVEDITPEGLEKPIISLGVFVLVALAILLAVLRRRRQRKLELWQNRFDDPEGKGASGLFPGIRTQTGEHPKVP
ncbi:MAG: vWA domain-containing protein, partial [Halieaceae bacterium]